ncbi:SDR family oxidoreductase [Shewanella baltica]|jgi:uncharacterized protein YbjT (DUF2867 family)|uniref:SDR family oxidoreductase n=1 Tax=Shewanella baltica TaxID=62322 RepID=UPI0030D511A9
MSKVFIVGAAGNVGRRLTQQLAQRGHTPMAMHRHPDQADAIQAAGGVSVLGDITQISATDLATLMSGNDAIVFSAGAGGKGIQLTNDVDGKGLELAVEAAQLAGIQRFILVSVFPDALRGGSVSASFENYMLVKKHADVHLVSTDLDWVILRPGTLLDEVGTGKVNAAVAIPYGSVSRDDVAATLVELIEQPKVNRIIIELTQGEIPINDAISRLVAQ